MFWFGHLLNEPAKQLSDGSDIDLLLMGAAFDVDPEVKDCFPISGELSHAVPSVLFLLQTENVSKHFIP